MSYFVPHKRARLGFALQTARGSAAAAPTVVMPLYEGGNMDWKKNYSFFQYTDGVFGGPTHYFSEGQNAEGRLRMPIVPGMLLGANGSGGLASSTIAAASDITDIGRWCFARDALSTGYGQGQYATIFLDLGHKAVYYADVKVSTVEISLKAREMCFIDVNCIGLATPATWTPTGTVGATDWATDDSPVTRIPYGFGNVSVSLAGSSDVFVNSLTFTHDQKLRDVGSCFTLANSVVPLYIPNMELAQVTGTLDRIFADSTIYDAFMAGTQVAIQAVIANAHAEATILLPTCLYTEGGVPAIPGEDILMNEGVAFQALAAADGSAHAWSITETAYS